MKKLYFFSIIAIALLGVGVRFAQAHGEVASVSDEVQTAIESMRQAKQRFLEARQNAADNSNVTSDRRQEALANRTDRRKDALLRILDVHQKHLEKTKDRVDGMPNITDEQKTEAKSAIDEALASVEALKAQVEAAADDEALRAVASAVRDQLKDYHTTVKRVVQAIHASRLTAFIDRALSRASALADELSSLQLVGKDVTALQEQLGQAQDLIAEAQSQSEGGELRTAIQSLKDAYALLRQVAQGVQALQPDAE